ncbi:FAD-binding oxidoreductase [Brevundimonas sp. NIBR11]|uniref:NAD(P)/FAD-dependent oxidoreductase n=1 Tax=Brevundimonas sp. NIBR11 TaxID=3015999 RepID=UPI0022F0590A|nr:FAD-binding oxidoreductase [Brevundimonas sp. NIBR11]WGM30736.1 tRNA 5-methylaminomethyl-2-thiouridine biosynthesis bifunctional protein MnmC [Brevundimonas sp. NIBR11]
MADISCDIVVIGAGVLGLSVAAELTARGHDVRVIDPGRTNASAVAAGMIAPAFESVLDGVNAERALLLRDAAALWPDFARRVRIRLDETPAEWRGADAEEAAETLRALGFEVEPGAVRVATDVRLNAAAALYALKASLTSPVIKDHAEAVEPTADGWRVSTTEGAVLGNQLVVATGAYAALPGLPGGTTTLIDGVQPIAGQIGRVAAPLSDRVVRGREAYVAPGAGGALIGATMVFGSRDLTPDPEASERLATAAGALLGTDAPADIEWRAGVRGATPDGLPLAGPVGDGLHLALAPRRNGWLLGPLVGRVVADGIEGRPSGPHAAALDPLRPTLPAG